MRKLLLIRHAKSSWKFPDLGDHERPLNRRGERDAVFMARYLADRDEALDVLFSSTATRALDFAQLISEFSGSTLIPDLTFYTFDVDELMEILQNLPDAARSIAIVGHNPAITRAVNRLCGSEIANVPTAGIAAIECSIDTWQQLGETQSDCRLDYFVTPKMLRHAG